MTEEIVVIDLFCGAGGAARGIEQACQDAGIGVTIIGVDNRPQPRYPYAFLLGEWDSVELDCADFVWASPPCQGYSRTIKIREGHGDAKDWPKLIGPVRARMKGASWVIENVPGAPLHNAITLCGTMFGLRVIRHRKFEASFPLVAPTHHPQHTEGTKSHRGYSHGAKYVTVAGHNYNAGMGKKAMQIDWMIRDELNEAVPPAYSRYIFSEWLKYRMASISLPHTTISA